MKNLDHYTVGNKINTPDPSPLPAGSRIVILGGGPSGAFFAIHLLCLARTAGKDIQVVIVDKSMERAKAQKTVRTRGCNFCAGVISPMLEKELARSGIRISDGVLCQEFTHVWIHGLWKNFPLKVPETCRLVSVFRGALPKNRQQDIHGFDAFILNRALDLGARLVTAEALDLTLSRGKTPRVILKPPQGGLQTLEGDFLCLATGVNAGDSPPILKAFHRLNPGFVPPRTRPALIFELKPGKQYLKKYIDQELYVIVTGSDKLKIDHAALVPKRDCLTVALMGKTIDHASFPEDTQSIIESFFSLDGLREILPGITPQTCPVVCSCSPLMAVSPARRPFGHRMGLAGDALGARLYRDGLYSSFIQTRNLAQAILFQGVGDKSLGPVYEEAIQWLSHDNNYGKRLMGLMQSILRSAILSRVLYQTFATEMKFKTMDQWPVGRLLWEIFTGAGEFKTVFRHLMSGSVLWSVTRGAIKTLRNVMTEFFFGLNWGRFGRYPAVVVKEKRDYIKSSISGSLGITLGKAPEMERMYAVKIRAPAQAIFRELGKFGEPGCKFLRLRFVDVRRISGRANEKGAVIRYNPCFLPIAMDISLILSLEKKALVYEPSPHFCQNGQLIFDISPTRDGNNRLVVYTAFDYKKGKRLTAKPFWFLFKHFFPDFAHDVVWNHAVCCIKAEAEKGYHASINEKQGLPGQPAQHPCGDTSQKPPFYP